LARQHAVAVLNLDAGSPVHRRRDRHRPALVPGPDRHAARRRQRDRPAPGAVVAVQGQRGAPGLVRRQGRPGVIIVVQGQTGRPARPREQRHAGQDSIIIEQELRRALNHLQDGPLVALGVDQGEPLDL
jgi:hypothetical protein